MWFFIRHNNVSHRGWQRTCLTSRVWRVFTVTSMGTSRWCGVGSRSFDWRKRLARQRSCGTLSAGSSPDHPTSADETSLQSTLCILCMSAVLRCFFLNLAGRLGVVDCLPANVGEGWTLHERSNFFTKFLTWLDWRLDFFGVKAMLYDKLSLASFSWRIDQLCQVKARNVHQIWTLSHQQNRYFI